MKTPLLCAAALSLVLALAGCGGGSTGSVTPSPNGGGSGGSGGGGSNGGGSGGSGGSTSETQPPGVSNAALSTTSMDFRGGPLTIRADVTDASGVQAVVATVQKSGGPPTDVPMSLSGTSYQAAYTILANQNSGGQADAYSVSIKATDTRGNATQPVAVGTVTVAAPDAGEQVPPPPSFPSLPGP